MILRMNIVGFHIFSLVFALRWSISLATLKCKGFRNVFLAQNTAVAERTTAMQNAYDAYCDDCELDIQPASATTHLNYIPLKDTDNYNAVKDACKALGTTEYPTSFCHVNSEMSVSNGQTGSKSITDDFVIRREPVCFPFQCKAAQAALAHPKPLGCDPKLTSCVVTDMEAVCATRPDGAGEGNCAVYAKIFAEDKTLIDAYTELYSDVGVECFNYKNDGNSEACITISEPVKLAVTKHFRPFKSKDAYRSFESACWEADGEVCYMSLSAQIAGEIVAYNFELIADYNDYPMCFPNSCSGDGMLQVARSEIGKEIAANINTAMKKDRRLSKMLPPDLFDRLLQTDDQGVSYCPVGDMEKCDVLVGDFYCTKSSGMESVTLISAGNTNTTSVPATPSAFEITPALYIAAMASAGVVLI